MTSTRLPVLQTADRALQVLLAFRERPEWGVTTLAKKLDLDKSVTQRLLATLARRGFVISDPDTRRYRMGPVVAMLARAAERSGMLEALARPFLADAARRADESAVLAVPHGFGYRCAAAVDADGPIRYTAIVGEVLPGHGGASGHAIFAFYPEQEIRRLCTASALQRFTAATITDVDDLLELYARVRRDEMALSYGEHDENVTAVAVPLRVDGEIIGSLTLVGAAERMRPKVDTCADLVREAGAALSASLSTTTDQR